MSRKFNIHIGLWKAFQAQTYDGLGSITHNRIGTDRTAMIRVRSFRDAKDDGTTVGNPANVHVVLKD